MKKVIEHVSFTIWGELEHGDGPLFWDGEKWSDDQGICSWTDEDAARYGFIQCQDDLGNIKRIRLVKDIVYRDEPDVETKVLEEKNIDNQHGGRDEYIYRGHNRGLRDTQDISVQSGVWNGLLLRGSLRRWYQTA